ncbi:choline transporter-like protein 3 isoform X2 [Rhinatrema bivittatum]|nr:choline transporter-like protein 3 isoform X2 [Rhinatrema bivittatum]XP_029473355.1 choline transporter-like protein 3 isoform X2 [Rhinatrema bivittatum]XP_029473356.1 choline transporter-like protein 3 isoform X2 [Rhinatrema bivittatum]XP_029473357.1 choline transporter-like protein 3 isoform X2 [Rhinatrema bivittatum]XP_029473359.1 choline transporter-like protein 3 isoform X2 [Rhinatrema bivittatum]
MFITGYAIMAGAAERLIFGYDSYGNVCGKRNPPVRGAPLSGRDMTDKKYIFFLDSCSLEIRNLKISSIALCVSGCPPKQLNTLEEVQTFAKDSGSYLCVYNLNYTDYTKSAELCPRLPVPPSKSFPLFNRCVPQNPDCYSSFASVLINVVNEVDLFHRILSGIMAGKDSVIGLSVFAVVLSFIMVLIFRYITLLLVHIFITLVVFGLLFVSGILWWLYYDQANDPSIELETEKENMKFLLGFAIVATVISVVLLILMCILRKRIQLTIQLFRVASKIISQVPFLLFQPLWTFIILIFFWVFWVAVLLSLGTAGSSQVVAEGRVEYKSLSGIRYMWWYHLAGLIWTSEFILACQQMVIAGAVVSLYFNRDKNNPPSHPILSSVSILFCYHQGTVIKGSFLISLTRIPRIIFMYLHNLLKGKGNGCARYLSKCCFCCLCCFEKCLCYLTQNAYAATVINGTSFCISAKEAFIILSRNSLNVASLNCFGDFLIFLGKVFVVCFTVFGGLMAFNYHRELHVWVVPLLLVAFFAYLVAHSFLSVFEMVIDVLFLCYAIDMETNDGSSEKPYFMDQDLMNLLDKTNKETEKIREREKSPQKHEDGTELQPMVRSE